MEQSLKAGRGSAINHATIRSTSLGLIGQCVGEGGGDGWSGGFRYGDEETTSHGFIILNGVTDVGKKWHDVSKQNRSNVVLYSSHRAIRLQSKM